MRSRSLTFRSALPLAFALFVVGCGGADAGDQDEAVGASEDALSVTFRATTDTTLKTSTLDSNELADDRKCAIDRGTPIKLSDVTAVGRHHRGRVAEAIPACAGKARFAVGQTVFLFEDHFAGGDTPPTTDLTGLPSCSPKRAVGAVGQYARAMLDAIAFAEGTRGRGQDGYDIIFTYRVAPSCNRHPRQLACSGGLCSDAAGRYQFLSTTWSGLGLSTFNPENQDKGAVKLVSRRGVSLPSSRPLTSTEFTNAMYSLSYEWASLPPGRYGQPIYSFARMRQEYCRHAGC